MLYFELNLKEFLTAIILIKEQYENQAKIVHAFSELDRTLEKVNIGISLISYCSNNWLNYFPRTCQKYC